MLKVLDLFSGIGGFSLGLERTGGFETVAFCEIDPFCQKVLKKHWPDVPIYNDVRNLNYDGPVDVITGGYPCQPFSLAGKRKGQDDDRHLWPAMFSLIQKYRPSWVIGENVAGHINMGLDQVLADLEGEDYGTRAFVIPACAVDAQHRRDRLWIVANSKSNGWIEGDPNFRGSEAGVSQREKQGPWNDSQTISDPDRRNGKMREQGGEQANGEEKAAGLHDRTSRYGNVWDAFPRTWPAEPNVGRVANGVPKRVDRLRSLGNAVVPQIPEMIGYAILEAERATK